MAGGYGGTLSILVVEDDHAVAELVRVVLNQIPGWGATVVHDAAAAREVFRHVRIEVLVVDVNLPGISGVELLDLLRHDPAWDEPPVFLMSANADQPDIRSALRGNAVTFIAKPFDVDRLVKEISTTVAERQSLTTSPYDQVERTGHTPDPWLGDPGRPLTQPLSGRP